VQLRQQLHESNLVVAPGVYDAFGALLAERAGFKALYVSGASLSYTRLGRPDIGLMSMHEVVQCVSYIRERTELPLVVDADTGYGNALNVKRTVALLERAGASAVQLEDQTSPKRCGHLSGKSLIPAGEMAGKIRAAIDARRSSETLIVARTDAIGVDGLPSAIDRAETYIEAGADVLFVESPRDLAELRAIGKTFGSRIPLVANVVEGGRTPELSAQELRALGYKLVIFPGGLVRAVATAAERYFANLMEKGSNRGLREQMLDFAGLNERVGLAAELGDGALYS